MAASLAVTPIMSTANAAPLSAGMCQKDFLNDSDYPNHCIFVYGSGGHIDRITLSLNLGDNRPVCATPELQTITPDGNHRVTQPMPQVCGNAPLVVSDYQLVAGHDYPNGETIGSNFLEYETIMPYTKIGISS